MALVSLNISITSQASGKQAGQGGGLTEVRRVGAPGETVAAENLQTGAGLRVTEREGLCMPTPV